MSDAAFMSRDWDDEARRRRSLSPSSRASTSQAILCAIAVVLGTPIGIWVFDARMADAPSKVLASPESPVPAPTSATRLLVAAPARMDVALLDPAIVAGAAPRPFGAAGPRASAFVPALPPAEPSPVPVPMSVIVPPTIASADVPLPLPRPAFRPALEARAAPPYKPHAGSTAPDRPSFFDRMFGASRPIGPALAYAAPDDGGFAGVWSRRVTPTNARTAIYDIAAHTVTLPSGARLEAHSGLGASFDNPRSVTEHMRGATPPATYDLTLRAGLFHGVQALRLNPSDPGATYGRIGLLAHSFMLGPRGESNGCVVFRDYAAFLRAYESGEIRRLEVIPGTT